MLISILANEKIHFVSICDPTMPKIWWVRKPIVRNIVSCFSQYWKGHLMSLTSNWYLLKISNSILTSSSPVCLDLQFAQKYLNCNLDKKISWLAKFVYLTFSKDAKVYNIWPTGYKDFLSYFSTRLTPCSHPTNEDNIWRLLNLGSSITKIILWVFLFSYFIKNERKKSNTPQTSFLVRNQQSQFNNNNWIIFH